MDRFYDKDDAKNIIESLTQERIEKDRMHLSRVLKDNDFIKSASIKRDDEVGVWRIIKQSEDDGTMEEMVFTIMGAIYAMDLPPVAKETRAQKEKVRFLSQSVWLVGLGSESFDNAMDAIRSMQVMGEREFRDGELEHWKPIPRNTTNDEEGIPFPNDVDPVGILAKMAQRKWIHTEDNEVQYYRGVMDERGKKRQAFFQFMLFLSFSLVIYVSAKPQIFRVGDIVEAQCSVVFLRTNEGTARMKMILRALALINSDNSTKATAERRNTTSTQSETIVRMKRKIGFEEEEEDVDVRAKKTNRMDDHEREERMTMEL
ncbi:uncharacterized protein EV420DRAFT_1646817 [Desarmillaria tabescens]|uniref:Uncharacterized protein n=1 Tax=Armillaria tabescens TaxID=1929756 RepID=A0AA39JWC0_ARMTA|nr:uncharacterized protein EV420DRAFT_1646817 [Desarmillaria tabescens]KAK0449817.1 hypothetical protein EV420DRAFT_1646817 [Desarmillaria tabescens]